MKKNPNGTYIADDPRFPAHIYPIRIMRTCKNGHEWGCVSKNIDEERVQTDKFLLWLVNHCPFCATTNKDRDIDDDPNDNVFALIK